jgi:hypothetical protein
MADEKQTVSPSALKNIQSGLQESGIWVRAVLNKVPSEENRPSFLDGTSFFEEMSRIELELWEHTVAVVSPNRATPSISVNGRHIESALQ